MPKKTTLRGQFLRTVLLMLACSLLVGLAVIVAVMIAFVKKVPDGEQFLMDSVSFLFGKEVLGPNGMIHVMVLAAIALCLLVVLVCVLLASRYTSRVAAALREFRRAADDLRSGELDFQILTYPERELDELAQALESVRQRLKATAAAEAAAQEERGLLMANLSHDLRTPITAIKGYVEGIQDGIAATPEKQQHYLDIVYNKTMVMEKLVRNMSDFSEYELGRMQYHFKYVDMLPFLQDLAEEYQYDVQQSGMTFQAELPKGSYTVTADRGKLERDYLEINGGFDCDLYDNGNQGLQAALSRDYALVIVDVMLPGLSGFEICRRLREVKDTPVIIISALADDIDKVRGLGLGADDYMTKSFSPSELVARVKGHIQRYERLVGSREQRRPEVLKIRGLEIDRDSRRVWVNGKETSMTGKEYDLLLFLAEHPDTVFSKDRLFDNVWGVEAIGDVSTVTVHIKHIRDKIELNPDRTQYIETVWGVGYRFRG